MYTDSGSILSTVFCRTNATNKSGLLFGRETQKISISSADFSKKKLMPPPQIKTSNFKLLHSFLVFPSRRFFFCFFLVTTPIFSIESTAGGHPRESGIPREGASEGGDFGFTLMGMGRRLDGWNFQGAEIGLIQDAT